MCIYLAENDAFLLLDIIGAGLHYILLSLNLNSWFRLTRGYKSLVFIKINAYLNDLNMFSHNIVLNGSKLFKNLFFL